MKQAANEGRSVPLLTTEEHRFNIGDVELAIPAGTSINATLDDAHLFISTAKDTLIDSAMAIGAKAADAPLHSIWASVYLLQLASAMNEAGHSGLISARAI